MHIPIRPRISIPFITQYIYTCVYRYIRIMKYNLFGFVLNWNVHVYNSVCYIANRRTYSQFNEKTWLRPHPYENIVSYPQNYNVLDAHRAHRILQRYTTDSVTSVVSKQQFYKLNSEKLINLHANTISRGAEWRNREKKPQRKSSYSRVIMLL